MDFSHRKEQYSDAYLKAVTAVAGYTLSRRSHDHDSVDWSIHVRGGGGSARSPQLDVQLKCTSSDWVRGDVLHFPLKRKNYDELTPKDLMVPRILVVVLAPADPAEWVDQTEDRLALRHCGYWLSLRGLPETANRTTVTVEVPRTQVFSADALTGIMTRIGWGALP